MSRVGHHKAQMLLQLSLYLYLEKYQGASFLLARLSKKMEISPSQLDFPPKAGSMSLEDVQISSS